MGEFEKAMRAAGEAIRTLFRVIAQENIKALKLAKYFDKP